MYNEGNNLSRIIGAGNGDRTRDPRLGKPMLYQLSYARPVTGSMINPSMFKIKENGERCQEVFSRPLKNTHLLRSPHPSSLRRTSKYASFLRVSGALHLGIFEQPEK